MAFCSKFKFGPVVNKYKQIKLHNIYIYIYVQCKKQRESRNVEVPLGAEHLHGMLHFHIHMRVMMMVMVMCSDSRVFHHIADRINEEQDENCYGHHEPKVCLGGKAFQKP